MGNVVSRCLWTISRSAAWSIGARKSRPNTQRFIDGIDNGGSSASRPQSGRFILRRTCRYSGLRGLRRGSLQG